MNVEEGFPAGRCAVDPAQLAGRRHVPEILDAVEADPAFPGMTVLDCRGFEREKAVSHRHVLPLEAALRIATGEAGEDALR